MQLRLRGLRRVTVKQPLPVPVYGDAEPFAFAAVGENILATVQPLSGTLEARIYGEESTRLLRMLTTNQTAIKEGMGVCVERTDGECDYRVAAPPERWSTHSAALLERLPAAQPKGRE